MSGGDPAPGVRAANLVGDDQLQHDVRPRRPLHGAAGGDDEQGATKLHSAERQQLLEAADGLLFGEPENRKLLRSAEETIEALEASGRWSAESCDQLREHLYGCDSVPD